MQFRRWVLALLITMTSVDTWAQRAEASSIGDRSRNGRRSVPIWPANGWG